MLSQRSRRYVSAFLLLSPIVFAALTVACTNPWAISREDLRAGKHPKGEQLRLTYPDGWVVLFDDWVLTYPYVEGEVDEMEGTVPSVAVEGKPKRNSFNVDDASKIEIVQFSEAETAATIVGSIALAVGLAVGLLVYLLSCPTVYVHYGTETVLVGEAYPGAMFRSLESDDFLRLPDQPSPGRELHLSIRNEHPEQQYIEDAVLALVDHPEGTEAISTGTRVLISAEGRGPLEAWDARQNNITDLLRETDEQVWQAKIDRTPIAGADSIEILFQASLSGNHVLILRAENTRWHDLVVGRFVADLGAGYETFLKLANEATRKEAADWRDRNGLALQIERFQDGGWRSCGSVPAAGTAAFRTLAVPVGKVDGETPVRLRISSGHGFWRIDSMSLAHLIDDRPVVQMVAASTVDGPRILAASTPPENRTKYRLSKVGDELDLRFPLPPAPQKMRRSLFLHTRGHYEIDALSTAPPAVATSLEDRREIRRVSGTLALELEDFLQK